jgi:hypothetical protein
VRPRCSRPIPAGWVSASWHRACATRSRSWGCASSTRSGPCRYSRSCAAPRPRTQLSTWRGRWAANRQADHRRLRRTGVRHQQARGGHRLGGHPHARRRRRLR